ncbi:asparagine synthetase [Aspergillus ambiguus]|uniref:asparagine synthetase B family protein n=1 Tax=Aspergillus ambiguus TaxID=176160 RepID=UPI003CCD4C28
MCGISAVFTAKQSSEIQTNSESFARCRLHKEVEDSLEVVRHRGPDASGIWVNHDGRIGLGHVRLSIVDLSPEANQPFHDAQGDIHAVVNGEFYGYEDHRAALSKEYDFRSNSDSEILIALYKHYGLALFSHLQGEFAFVLWDARRQLLLSARDRYGIKSLYYTVVDNRLLVATEMKSFLAFGWKPEWSVPNLKSSSWQHSSETFFKSVHSVLPGHYLLSRDIGTWEQRPYWDLEYPDKRTIETRSEAEIIAGTRERLLEAVRSRLRADVPVGIYLSGGIDSSAIAGMVAHLVKKEKVSLGSDKKPVSSKIKCFTVQFEKESGTDESDVAKRTADWLGVELHTAFVDEDVMVSKFEDTIWHSETLFPHVNGPGKLALAELARSQGITVVLTGEGSDEHFAGYSVFFDHDVSLEADYSWPEGQMPIQKPEPFRPPRCLDEPPLSTNRMLNHISSGKFISRVIRIPFSSWCEQNTCPETSLAESLNGRVHEAIAKHWHPLNTSQYLFIKAFLPHFILRYNGDNIDMVHQIESRPPFLDNRVTEYANKIPPSLRIKYDPDTNKFREKHILREAMRPFLTDEVYHRKKQPYIGPVQFKKDGPLHRKFKSLLTEENVDQLGFVDWNTVSTALEQAFSAGDPGSFATATTVAQLVVISQRFGVKRAEPPF